LKNGKIEKWKNGKIEKWKNGKMEKWKNLKREALLYHLSFIIFHLSTNGH
jgi:hypothetical protein